MPMFPLSTVLFPGAPLALQVFEARYRQMIAECLEHGAHEFGVVLIARGPEVGGGDERTDVGTVARIEALSRLDDERFALLARGGARLRVTEWMADDPYPQAVVELLDDGPGLDEDARGRALAAVRRVEALRTELGAAAAEGPCGPDVGVWELCRRLPVNALDRQRLLAAPDGDAAAALLAELASEVAEDLTRLLAGG